MIPFYCFIEDVDGDILVRGPIFKGTALRIYKVK